MVKVQVDVLPDVSVAVHVTVVVPTGKGWPDVTTEPFWSLQTKVTPGQLSVAVTVKVTGALVAIGHEATAATLISAGQIMVGGCVSFTVTVKLQLAMLLEESFTVQVTVVVPFGNVEPDGGEHMGVPTPGQLSVAVALL